MTRVAIPPCHHGKCGCTQGHWRRRGNVVEVKCAKCYGVSSWTLVDRAVGKPVAVELPDLFGENGGEN